MTATRLKVLTLNCWGVFVPISCKLRSQRISAIGHQLGKGEYDVVILQEVWCQSDYQTLCASMLTAMPYTHYFHSGSYGSGVCVFSKHVIFETHQHIYTLNGYAHRVFCGDWYGGKLVGLAKILVGELRVNVYATHLHAQYYDPDDYEAHRISQSFELSQFIRATSDRCDFVLVGGDLNYRPDQLGYHVVRYNANLDDAWLARKAAPEAEGCYEPTCDRPDNSFHSSPSKRHPQGVTLDYILFRQHSGYSVQCEQCLLAMRKIPEESFNYSDHEGVAATFLIKRNAIALGRQRELAQIEKHLVRVLPLLDAGVHRARAALLFYVILAFLSVVALAFLLHSDLPSELACLALPAQVLLTALICFCLLMVFVWTDRELKGLRAVQGDVNVVLKNNVG